MHPQIQVQGTCQNKCLLICGKEIHLYINYINFCDYGECKFGFVGH